MAIINAQGQEIPETWTYGQAETPLAPHVIVPLAALPPAGEPLPSPLGVQLPPETQAESIAARLGDFTLDVYKRQHRSLETLASNITS